MSSSCSGVVLDRMRAHSPKSTRALLRARAAFDSSTPALSTAGTVFGISTTVVTPPAAAAAVRVPKSSFSGNPGSRLWTWASTAPGSTYMPVTSISAPSGPIARPRSTRTMAPSLTCTSARRGPSGVYTVPPLMRSSVKFEVLNPEKRRVRNARLANVFLAAFSAVQHHNQVNHFESGVAQHLQRAQRVSARGDDVLDHRDAFSGGEMAFDLFGGAVTLRLLAHEQKRQAGLHRHRASEQDGAELRRGESLRFLRN